MINCFLIAARFKNNSRKFILVLARQLPESNYPSCKKAADCFSSAVEISVSTKVFNEFIF